MISIVKFGEPITFFFLSFLALFLCPLFSNCQTDTLFQGQELKDEYHLDSASGVFRLGFFTGPDCHCYLGIWYNVPEDLAVQDRGALRPPEGPSPVWVGNANIPILYRTWVLTIASDGNLKIVNGEGDEYALTAVVDVSVSGKTSAVLLDSGNFVLSELSPDGSVKRKLWQSFDYPTDTLLPGMKLGANLRTGHVWSLKPWPEPSNFTFGMNPNGTTKNQLVILWNGQVFWRSGEGLLNPIFPGYIFSYVSDDDGEERYMVYKVRDNEIAYPRITITSYGFLTGHDRRTPRRTIKRHGFLTGHDRTALFVGCEWKLDRSDGCFAGDDTPICSGRFERFYDLAAVQGYNELPAAGRRNDVRVVGDCRLNCSQNCTCLAYARQNRDGSGCQMRMILAYSLPRSIKGQWSRRRQHPWLIAATVVPSTGFFILLFVYLGWRQMIHFPAIISFALRSSVRELWKCCGSRLVMCKEYVLLQLSKNIADVEEKMLLRELGMASEANANLNGQGSSNDSFQLFSFEHIASATNNFHPAKKLGRGGFGPVYKGKLSSGLEVAIKRLSTSSRQGLVEFKNEVRLIAKLQHENLVRLVGCCIEKGEKILVYEYLPNKSLDFSLFAPGDQNALDWKKRFEIIQGIAQGLLYLHKYSRLKIVHRDLKASNILLDSEMNPKISDFGLAKIFHPNESRAITGRVAGTFGYMSPEYAMEGVFSTKSDVFSFGVLLLEIVSGKRNNHFHGDQEGPSSLIAWAWELWREGRGMELVDPSMAMDIDNSSNMYQSEVLKCIQIGLLCVQENPRNRPSMLEITSMIYNNDSSRLPPPNRPAFYYRMNSLQEGAAEIVEVQEEENWTVNKVTITEMNAR